VSQLVVRVTERDVKAYFEQVRARRRARARQGVL
jgi:hypothetical protein